jgi:4'-phosphopantetheinyl transferase
VIDSRVVLRCVLTQALDETRVASDFRLLDARERHSAMRLSIVDDRRDYITAHALLRRMLTAEAPGIAPTDWSFERTALGKPHLRRGLLRTAPLHFNIAHARGLVACVLCRDADVGVDVEYDSHAIDLELIIPRVCSSDEQDQLQRTVSHARTPRFLDFWTLKEAYVKACGVGIGDEEALPQIAFDLRRSRGIGHSLPGNPTQRWQLALARPTPDSRVALAMTTTPSGRFRPVDAAIIGIDQCERPLPLTRVSEEASVQQPVSFQKK